MGRALRRQVSARDAQHGVLATASLPEAGRSAAAVGRIAPWNTSSGTPCLFCIDSILNRLY